MAVHSYKKSAHRGVSANWSRWRAQIYVNGRRHELGSFTSEAEAARAYDLAAIRRASALAQLFTSTTGFAKSAGRLLSAISTCPVCHSRHPQIVGLFGYMIA